MKREPCRLELLREKKELMLKFLNLTEKQSRVIKEKNYDDIFNIINEKQSVIERVNLIDLKLKEIEEKPDQQLKELVNEIKEVVQRALEVDEENIKILKENRSEIAEKLKAARKNTKTHSLYRGKNKAFRGVLVDKKR